jgi:hypothetical protein
MSQELLMWILGLVFVVHGAILGFIFWWLKHLSGEMKQATRDIHQLSLDVSNQYVRGPALEEAKSALRDFSQQVTHSIDGLQTEVKELSKAVYMFMGGISNK